MIKRKGGKMKTCAHIFLLHKDNPATAKKALEVFLAATYNLGWSDARERAGRIFVKLAAAYKSATAPQSGIDKIVKEAK